MKSFTLPAATAAAGLAVGLLLGSGALHAQITSPLTAPASPLPPTAPAGTRVTSGTIQVERLTDTTFVVVKDVGDEAVVTLFSTQDGIVQKKHSGRFFY